MSGKSLNVTPKIALALAVQVYNDQGFVRSGDGYSKWNASGEYVGEVKDNKSRVIELIKENQTPKESSLEEAQRIMEKFEGKFMLKKLTDGLTSFEKSVSDAFSGEKVSAFTVAVIASIPHMDVVDIKRQTVSDRLEELRFESEYFGESKKRYDISVDIIDVKFIQSSAVYMITSVHNNKDIIKFWWRDQPDLSDIIDGRTINIRGTVNRHEIGRYTQAKETMLNRVKIISN
jgi:hypothetical protein